MNVTFLQRLFFLGVLLVSWQTAGSQVNRSKLTVTILDQDQKPTPARVRFTDREGTYFAPEGIADDFVITSAQEPLSKEDGLMLDEDRRFAYTDGSFKIMLPQKRIYLEVVKGFRYRIFKDTFDLKAGSKEELKIQLTPFADLPLEDWYSGDVHVHYIDSETALLQMQCEDLNVCNLLISDFTVDQAKFRGAIEPISQPEHIVYYGQEYREDRLGHINLLNIKSGLIEPAREARKFQYPLNIDACDLTHQDNGHVSWAHFAAWPGLEGPLGLILKKVDAVELLCTIDPFQEPIFASDIVPELPMNSGLRLYYRLLNCGLNIPVTAGTDKMNNQVSVGANRVYARVQNDFNYENWITSINQGQTFITNGPFITCTVDEYEAGSVINGSKKSSHKIRAEVWSQFPVDRLEIICNGELIAEQTIEESQNHAEVEIDFEPEESSWIVARAYQLARPYLRNGLSLAQRRDAGAAPTPLNRYFGTLRPEMFFAHTSPIYLNLEGKPAYSASDVKYFIEYLENASQWLEKEGSFPDEESKKEVLAAFRKGIEAFQQLPANKN